MLYQKRPTLPLSMYLKKRGSYLPVQDDPKQQAVLGYTERGELFFWGHRLYRLDIEYRKARKMLTYAQIALGAVLGIGFMVLFFWALQTVSVDQWFTGDFWLGGSIIPTLWWLSMVSLLFVLYRALSLKQDIGSVYQFKEKQAPNQQPEVGNISAKHSHDISKTFTDQALEALGAAYQIADAHGDQEVLPLHVFYALLLTQDIRSLFIRLRINPEDISKVFEKKFAKQKNEQVPVLSEDVRQSIFYAYTHAQEIKQQYVHVTELLEEVVRSSETIQELLYDQKVDEDKLVHVVDWIRIKEQMRRRYQAFRKSAALRSKHGIDRAMTAVATPYLDSFSKDVTHQAKMGHFAPCVARDKEMQEVYRVLQGGAGGVLLVGEGGVGKHAIIEGLAQRILEDDVPSILHDKRLVELSMSALLAGTTVSGAQERLIGIMNEIARAGNIVLFINNIHDLFGAGSEQGSGGFDVSESLAEYLKGGRFVTIATTNHEGFQRFIANSELSSSMQRVEIDEMSVDGAIHVLESKAGSIEYKHNVFFAYEAIEKAADLASRFLTDQYLPESAINLVIESASYVKQKHGKNSMVTAEDVATVVSDKTGIPTNTITQDEGGKLLALEDAMHNRVIGQDEAVTEVANALRRARAEVRSSSRPIANFLFLGPTGVGKTELAKTIAAVYFGGEEQMIRVDMSEYQDRGAIYRLIGQAGQKGSGVLTEAVRQKPFSLILLDELEKADKDVLNLFLQVFDDGRLTDSVGRVVDFTNVIIIATSNAGTEYVQKQIEQHVPYEKVKEELLHSELSAYYRPEFLNRFDGIILFESLSREDIIKIAGLMLKRIEADLKAKGIFMEVKQTALEHLATVGYDPQFGARPMRRAIQDVVENKLAELLLSGKVKRRDTIVLTGGDIIVRPAS